MLPFLAPILSMLAGKGLDLLSGAVAGGADKAIEFISKKTGIDLSKKQSLSNEDIIKLKEFENSNKIELEKLALENKKEDNKHDEAIRLQSHKTYRENSTMADIIAIQIIKYNLPIIAILVLVNIGVIYLFKTDTSLIAIVSNIIGIAIGNLFSERQSIINFFFGSSIGSKDKSDKLDSMNKAK